MRRFIDAPTPTHLEDILAGNLGSISENAATAAMISENGFNGIFNLISNLQTVDRLKGLATQFGFKTLSINSDYDNGISSVTNIEFSNADKASSASSQLKGLLGFAMPKIKDFFKADFLQIDSVANKLILDLKISQEDLDAIEQKVKAKRASRK